MPHGSPPSPPDHVPPDVERVGPWVFLWGPLGLIAALALGDCAGWW